MRDPAFSLSMLGSASDKTHNDRSRAPVPSNAVKVPGVTLGPSAHPDRLTHVSGTCTWLSAPLAGPEGPRPGSRGNADITVAQWSSKVHACGQTRVKLCKLNQCVLHGCSHTLLIASELFSSGELQ